MIIDFISKNIFEILIVLMSIRLFYKVYKLNKKIEKLENMKVYSYKYEYKNIYEKEL